MASSDTAIEAIYAASLDPSGWQTAVERISETFEAPAGALYVEDYRGTTVFTPGVIFGHGAAEVAAYGQYFCARNPFNRIALREDAVGVMSDTTYDQRFGRYGLFANGEYYADWVRPQALRHVVGQRIRSIGDAMLCAAFWRPGDAGSYSEAEVAEFERMMRHVNRSIDIGTRLQIAEAEMGRSSRNGGAAVFTLGSDGRIRQCNAVADALLASGSALIRSDGRLRTTVSQDQGGLDRLIACAFDPRRAAWAENARVAIRRADDKPALTVKIAAVAQRFSPFAPDRAAAAVLTVEGFEAESDLRIERLRRRFGLTPTQARFAEVLCKGKTLREAAAELGVGLETARSHLRAVFRQTDTHRQAELVLLLRELDGR